MKIAFTFFALLVVCPLFGQLTPNKLSGISIQDYNRYLETDTIPRVIYLNTNTYTSNLKVYLNGEMVDQQVLNTIDMQLIKDMKINKESDSTDGDNYDGVLHITMKDGYQPKLITLNMLCDKYIEQLTGPMLFMLNDVPMKVDHDKYLIDENYLMKIEVDKIQIDNEELYLNLIKLITRTKKNLEKVNTILIRGEKS